MSSINEEYGDIVKTYKNAIEKTTLRQDSEEYQTKLSKNIQDLVELKSTVSNKLALFSNNETIEDLSTSSLKFLSIDCYLALMCTRKQSSDKAQDLTMKNRLKLVFLEKSVQLFVQFLISLQDYEILDQFLTKKINSFKATYKPTLDELYQMNSEGNMSASAELNQAYAKREQKIEIFQRNKLISSKIEQLESKLNSIEIESEGDKEDILRELYIDNLKQLSYRAFNEIEQILYESELLSNFIKNPPPMNDKIEPIHDQRFNNESSKDATGYTEKLEILNKPLLSKNGKILRNFTLINKKVELQGQVRGYGQYGPTMSVEEFLQKELDDGRVLQGGPDSAEPQDEVDEDNNEHNDTETYKAREWDAFKEANAKGSGNTINRG